MGSRTMFSTAALLVWLFGFVFFFESLIAGTANATGSTIIAGGCEVTKVAAWVTVRSSCGSIHKSEIWVSIVRTLLSVDSVSLQGMLIEIRILWESFQLRYVDEDLVIWCCRAYVKTSVIYVRQFFWYVIRSMDELYNFLDLSVCRKDLKKTTLSLNLSERVFFIFDGISRSMISGLGLA